MKLKRLVFFFLILILSFPANRGLSREEEKDQIYLIPIKGIIELGLSSFVERSVKAAEEAGARLLILEIDTFGGRVDAAVEIRDLLFRTDIETAAFVNQRAISAGALLSLACRSIVMAPGSTIGAAQPVKMMPGGVQQQPTSEKEISYVRKEFKATAERNNHPTRLAEAMVDADIELKAVRIDEELFVLSPSEVEEKKNELGKKKVKIIEADIPAGFGKGKLLTLTTEEALRFKVAHHSAKNLTELLVVYGLEDADVIRTRATWSENFVRFLTHPIISGLLLTLGMLGLIFELRMPGWGISGTIGLLCLALFFWGHYLAGLAGRTDIFLFVLGAALLALEIFVIPGFGIAGISGIICLVASVFLALIKHPFRAPINELERALSIIIYSFISVFLVAILSFRFFPRSGIWQRFILQTRQIPQRGYTGTSPRTEDFLGKEGKTISPLRPSGKAMFGDKTLDVVSEGEFIGENCQVKVTRVEGNRIVVEKV